jgi:hypothetical protein
VDLRHIIDRMRTADKYYVMESNARVLPYVKIALIFSSELVEEGKFAETVAANRGVHLKSFMDHKEAVVWLTYKQPHQVTPAEPFLPASANFHTSGI